MTKPTAQQLLRDVNKTLGEDVLRMASDRDFVVEYQPTGVLPFDILLQGGVPKGRFTEVYGDASTLKSYIGYSTIAQTQQAGGIAALIDTEHSFDPAWADTIGVDVRNLIIQRPPTGELAIDTAETLIRGGVALIVFDSIAATLPQQEQTKRLHRENIQPARLAQLMSTACRRLTAANDKTALLWINQTRIDVGITFGSNETMPGGRAMPYYASYRIRVKKTGKLTQDIRQYNGEKWVAGKEQIGQKYKASVEKSKLNKPFREIWFDWGLTVGQVDLPAFLVAQGVEHGIITVAGNTWTYGSTKAIGRERFSTKVSADQNLMDRLQTDVLAKHGLGTPSTTTRTIRRRK